MVYATTVTHPREGTPYNVALVDCDEGFRLMSRVEDIAPEAVKIGMRVKFRVHRPGGDEPPYPVFVPVVPTLSAAVPAANAGPQREFPPA